MFTKPPSIFRRQRHSDITYGHSYLQPETFALQSLQNEPQPIVRVIATSIASPITGAINLSTEIS